MKEKINYKISFLIAAHNEEKIIKRTIENLLSIPYENFEILVGLDGCTDKTERIVENLAKKDKRLKFYSLNLREGKPAVINAIIKKAQGEIIIINDADWIFEVKNKEQFKKFISVFDDEKVGGIAESFPAEWHEDLLNKGNLGFLMEAYSSYLWYEFQKKNFSERIKGKRYVKTPKMFLTNVFRKKLYEENSSLGDDFERSYDIMKKKYCIVLFDEINIPRIKTTYYEIGLKDLFKQKIRTAIARNQLNESGKMEVDTGNYYIPATLYILKNSWKFGMKVGLMMIFWVKIMVITTLIAKFKSVDTKEGWKMRLER